MRTVWQPPHLAESRILDLPLTTLHRAALLAWFYDGIIWPLMTSSVHTRVAKDPTRPFFAYIAPKAAHEPFNPAPWYLDHWDPSWFVLRGLCGLIWFLMVLYCLIWFIWFYIGLDILMMFYMGLYGIWLYTILHCFTGLFMLLIVLHCFTCYCTLYISYTVVHVLLVFYKVFLRGRQTSSKPQWHGRPRFSTFSPYFYN